VVVLATVGVLGGRQAALMRAAAADAPGHAFTISGTVAGLVPGKPMPLLLTVHNTEAQPIRVTSLTATAQAASKSCPASLVAISTYPGNPQTVVAARSQAVVALSITLSAETPDGCRRVSFPLSYTGKAEQWH
jgi:hypothetical protein